MLARALGAVVGIVQVLGVVVHEIAAVVETWVVDVLGKDDAVCLILAALGFLNRDDAVKSHYSDAKLLVVHSSGLIDCHHTELLQLVEFSQPLGWDDPTTLMHRPAQGWVLEEHRRYIAILVTKRPRRVLLLLFLDHLVCVLAPIVALSALAGGLLCVWSGGRSDEKATVRILLQLVELQLARA